jgi:AcrR family transcriptional regulator
VLDIATHTAEKIDPRVKRTRKLIVDAFVSLQAEKSFDDITIQDIAERATVNRATFYAHFQDKYALLDSIIHDGFEVTLRYRLDTPIDDTHVYLRQLFLAVTDHLTGIQTRCQRSFGMFGSLVEAQIKAQVREHVQTWLAAGPKTRAVPKQRRELAATLISWSIYGAALEWQDRAGSQSAESFAEEALPLIAATITVLGS